MSSDSDKENDFNEDNTDTDSSEKGYKNNGKIIASKTLKAIR